MDDPTEMTDSEMWKAYKQASQQKRSNNRNDSIEILKRLGVHVVSRNMGAHLTVTHGIVVDFWPGTGKWITREPKAITGRGVWHLLRYLKVPV